MNEMTKTECTWLWHQDGILQGASPDRPLCSRPASWQRHAADEPGSAWIEHAAGGTDAAAWMLSALPKPAIAASSTLTSAAGHL